MEKKVNLGCGKKKLKGYKNYTKEQINIEKRLPFKKGTIKEIKIHHVLEHCKTKPHKIIKEMHRVLKKGGKITINVPHYKWHNAYDEDHERFFNILSLKPRNNNDKKDIYNKFKRETKLLFYKEMFIHQHIIEKIVNINETTKILYETSILSNIIPPNQIKITLTKK